jgi:hypothetical protein
VTEKLKESNQRSRLKRQNLINEYKTPCVKCSESRPYIIDWHHIDPTNKSFTLSKGAKEKSRAMILDEIRKCACLCRNCHAEFHYLYGHKATESDFNKYIKE